MVGGDDCVRWSAPQVRTVALADRGF